MDANARTTTQAAGPTLEARSLEEASAFLQVQVRLQNVAATWHPSGPRRPGPETPLGADRAAAQVALDVPAELPGLPAVEDRARGGARE
jgi:hypothetical protein